MGSAVKHVGVGGGDADGRLAFGGDGGGEAFVEQAGEDHDGDVASFSVGNAEAGDKFALDTHALERGGEEPSAAVHNEDLVTFVCERGDLARERANDGFDLPARRLRI